MKTAEVRNAAAMVHDDTPYTEDDLVTEWNDYVWRCEKDGTERTHSPETFFAKIVADYRAAITRATKGLPD